MPLRRIPSSFPVSSLAVSAALHGVLVTAIALELDIFGADDAPEVEFVEAQILSAEEFDQLTAAPEPEPTPPEAVAALPEPEPRPAPQPPDAPAPYETAPEAPNPLVFDPGAASDAPVEDQIRQALPKPRVARPAPAPTPPRTPEAAPEIDPDTDAPPPEKQAPPEPAPSPRPRIANAPPQPAPSVRDQAPKPDQPDTPPTETAKAEPEPEPKPEPEKQPEPEPEKVAAAPTAAPARPPRPRPRRAPARDLAKELDTAVDRAKRAQVPDQAERAAQRSRAPVVGQPLSLAEKNGLRISLRRCWSRPDPAGVDPSLLVVKLTVQLRQDGRLSARPRVILPRRITEFRQRAAILAAQQAIARCQPYRLPPAKYASWRTVNVTFDPRDQAPGVQ